MKLKTFYNVDGAGTGTVSGGGHWWDNIDINKALAVGGTIVGGALALSAAKHAQNSSGSGNTFTATPPSYQASNYQQNSSPPQSKLSTGAIVGISVGGLAIVGLLVALAIKK